MPGMVVLVVFVAVALVGVMDVARLIAMMLVSIALVGAMVVSFGVVFVGIALVRVMNVARFVAVMLVSIALVDVVKLHRFPLLFSVQADAVFLMASPPAFARPGD